MGLKDLGNLVYGSLFGGTVVPPQHKKQDGSWVETGENNPLPTQLTGSNGIQGKLKTVTTAGARVQLDDTPCREVTIIARKGNLGMIYIGGSDVSSTVFGAELEAKDSITLAINNANLVFIDASVSGEGVSYVTI